MHERTELNSGNRHAKLGQHSSHVNPHHRAVVVNVEQLEGHHQVVVAFLKLQAHPVFATSNGQIGILLSQWDTSQDSLTTVFT